MANEARPSPAFQLWSALCIAYLVGVAWWAFLIVGPERYSWKQWLAIALGPPLFVIVRSLYMKWVWGRFRRWFWGVRW